MKDTITAEPLSDTQLHPDDIEPVRVRDRHDKVTWEEVEDATLVINPDAASMDDRG